MTVFNSMRHMNMPPGETVAVQGLGGLCHLAIQTANRMGYRTIAISRGVEKETFARKLGAHEYIDASKCDVFSTYMTSGGSALMWRTAAALQLGKVLKFPRPAAIT